MQTPISKEELQLVLKNNGFMSNNIVPVQSGYNRLVFSIDDRYILKVCINPNYDFKAKNELHFHQDNKSEYFPNILVFDQSKTVIPYIYIIEEKASGENLFNCWSKLSSGEREDVLEQLLIILKKIHKPIIYDESLVSGLLDMYSHNLFKTKSKHIFTNDEMLYLESLLPKFRDSLSDVRLGYIHGDIHFDNIIYSKSGIKLIDFECYEKAPIDKEFDSVCRMIRNPNSYVRNGESGTFYNADDYQMIMSFFKQNYPEICGTDDFDDHIIIYDSLNSIKWINKFPDHKLYWDVLFNDTRRIRKK